LTVAIDGRFVDVDGLPSQNVFSGVLPEVDPPGKRGFELFGNVAATIPRGEWRDLVELSSGAEAYVRKIKNQRSEGSCVSNATTSAFECIWNRSLGLDAWVEMSAISLYKRCGSSPGSGSMLSTNLREMRDVGALPTNTAENKQRLEAMGCDSSDVMPETGFYTAFPSGWKDTAKFFRFQEVVELSGLDEIASALLENKPVVFARAGHCIMGVRLVYDNGQYAVKYANSWGAWGDNGYGYDTESYFKRSGAANWAFMPVANHIPDSLAADVPAPKE
jgi:hypothetical protein